MTYGTLLLHLDEHPRLAAHIDTALQLARRFGSHVVGLAASGNKPFEANAAAGFLNEEQLSHVLSSAHRLAAERVRRFSERARQAGVRGFDARIDDDDDAPALLRAGLCCDLAILAQPDPDFQGRSRRRAQFEQALLLGAPPVIVLPFHRRGEEIGTRVLVGWNDSRECARAVAAALPLLRRAAQVRIVGVVEAIDGEGRHAPPHVDRAREWLARGGVKSEASVHPTPGDAGEQLLVQAAADGADLIVMGAWGHARWAEQLFGGATRTVLARTTVPVFMAR